jgi:hypothetical protein
VLHFSFENAPDITDMQRNGSARRIAIKNKTRPVAVDQSMAWNRAASYAFS